MRLLIVEDDRRIAADMVSALATAGYGVETCRNGEEAWFLGDTEDYDLVVLDIGLPGMDGYALARQLRDMPETADAMLVALSGYGQAQDRALSQAAGFDAHLIKPANFAELRSILARASA